MKEYKGIYYGDESEKKYFEYGAHFKYIKLYKILERIAIEQKLEEKQKELYVNKRNKITKISNNNNKNYLENDKKEKKSRNVQDYFNNNITSTNTTNNIKNKSYANVRFIQFNQKKGTNENIIIDKVNNNQTYILINNKLKDNSYGKTKSLAIKNQKKIIISRNNVPSTLIKARPNTILKEGLQGCLFFGKNNLLSSSIDQKNQKKRMLIENLNKRSFPNINNLIFKSNEYYPEMYKLGGKTDMTKKANSTEKCNKSQNNLNRIKIKINSIINKKSKSKIKKKNYIMTENKYIKEKNKSNLTNYIFKNFIEQINNKNEKEKENDGMKSPKMKKIMNKKPMLSNNTNFTSKVKITFGNQLKKIIYKPNITQKLNKKIITNLKKPSFKEKSRNNNGISEINNSFNIKSNKNIKSRNNVILNTTRSKNNDGYKTTYKIILEKGKIFNMKQNNRIQNKSNINKFTPKTVKRINENPGVNPNITSDNNKNIKYNLISNIPLDKEKIAEKINKNNLSELKNKTLNINIINNTCIYIKPKQPQKGLHYKSRNERVRSDIKSINLTQRTIIKKKKPLMKAK